MRSNPVLLFFIGPTLFAYTRHRIPAIPVLWGLTAYCLLILLPDPGFDRGSLWNTVRSGNMRRQSFACSPRRQWPESGWSCDSGAGLFLNFPRSNPRLWSLVVMLYPVLSVYRAGHRLPRLCVRTAYRDLSVTLGDRARQRVSRIHVVDIVFRNRLALVLTLLGGVLFGIRFLQTGSLFVTSFEHALYGCFLFTVGVGRSFHHGSARGTDPDGRAFGGS